MVYATTPTTFFLNGDTLPADSSTVIYNDGIWQNYRKDVTATAAAALDAAAGNATVPFTVSEADPFAGCVRMYACGWSCVRHFAVL